MELLTCSLINEQQTKIFRNIEINIPYFHLSFSILEVFENFQQGKMTPVKILNYSYFYCTLFELKIGVF